MSITRTITDIELIDNRPLREASLTVIELSLGKHIEMVGYSSPPSVPKGLAYNTMNKKGNESSK